MPDGTVRPAGEDPDRAPWQERRKELRKAIEGVINAHSGENESNTPDFLLAEFLMRCFDAFTVATRARERWYGYELRIGGPRPLTAAEVLPPPPPEYEQRPAEPPCDGWYTHALPSLLEPFQAYRCGKPIGHEGPHGPG